MSVRSSLATFALALPLMGLAAAGAWAQTAGGAPVATGAGRDGELDENARIDAYLSDAASAPSARAQSRVTASEADAGARALPPMAPDSPWARGVPTPIDGPLSLAGVNAPGQPCDHRIHGEVGAEIGTGGEKGGYGVASAPIGKDCQTQVTIGVSSYHGRGYGGGYGGYGYGGYDRNRTQDAISLGFSTGGRRGDPQAPPPPPEY